MKVDLVNVVVIIVNGVIVDIVLVVNGVMIDIVVVADVIRVVKYPVPPCMLVIAVAVRRRSDGAATPAQQRWRH